MTSGRISAAAGTWTGQTWYADDIGSAPALPVFKGSRRCRVAIIGAGLAGLSTATALLERGVRDVRLRAGG